MNRLYCLAIAVIGSACGRIDLADALGRLDEGSSSTADQTATTQGDGDSGSGNLPPHDTGTSGGTECCEPAVGPGCAAIEPCTSTSSDATDSTTGNDSTTGTNTDTGTTGEPPDNIGSCCNPHPETGCEFAGLAACVCAQEAECCTDQWSDTCVDAIATYGCGVCPPEPMTTSDTGTTGGEPPDNLEGCCIEHASTGCEYAGVAECVCDGEPQCCSSGWDASCVAAVGALGCGVCPP